MYTVWFLKFKYEFWELMGVCFLKKMVPTFTLRNVGHTECYKNRFVLSDIYQNNDWKENFILLSPK